MYIRTDDNDNIVEFVQIGGMPEVNGYEIDTIDNGIIKNIFSYKYIDGEFVKKDENDILQENIEDIRYTKLNRMRYFCQKNIENGITVNGSHYSLTTHDQIELIKLESMVKMNAATPIFYHADGEKCRLFSSDEFLSVSTMALGWITYNRTYFNLLKSEINEMTDTNNIININYGSALNQTNKDILNTVMGDNIILFDFPIIEDDFDYKGLCMPSSPNEIFTPASNDVEVIDNDNIE